MSYLLCHYCLERHPSHPDAQAAPTSAECFICQGFLERLPALVEEAIHKSIGIEWDTFAAQSTFPRLVMVREEELLDGEDVTKAMSLKNQINRVAIDLLEKKTGKPFSHQPQMQFKLDFLHNKGEANPTPIFIFGRYIKRTREYCQHDWACRKCNGRGCKFCGYHKQMWPSIESAIRGVYAPAFGASGGYLHCSGREDVDVMNTGGRPFVLELLHPRKRNADVLALAAEVAKQHPLEVLTPQFASAWWTEAVCVSHFDKHYRAWVEADQPLTDAHWTLLKSHLPLVLAQRTPIRVMERRSDLVRRRRVYSIAPHALSPKEWVLDVHAEAGTYIKELIHGDQGRTVPSISSILGFPCRCKQLDVTGFDDWFADTLDGPKD